MLQARSQVQNIYSWNTHYTALTFKGSVHKISIIWSILSFFPQNLRPGQSSYCQLITYGAGSFIMEPQKPSYGGRFCQSHYIICVSYKPETHSGKFSKKNCTSGGFGLFYWILPFLYDILSIFIASISFRRCNQVCMREGNGWWFRFEVVAKKCTVWRIFYCLPTTKNGDIAGKHQRDVWDVPRNFREQILF